MKWVTCHDEDSQQSRHTGKREVKQHYVSKLISDSEEKLFPSVCPWSFNRTVDKRVDIIMEMILYYRNVVTESHSTSFLLFA